MRRISVFSACTVLLAISATCFAQVKGYISTDSAYRTGFVKEQKKILLNRKVSFAITKVSPSINYFPDDLITYGFKNEHYVSKFVQEGASQKKYFLLTLVDKNVKLYSLKTGKSHRFFGEKDSTLIELKKDSSFQETLTELLPDNDFHGKSIAKFNRKSLTRVFKLYGESYRGYFPSVRIGMYVGVSKTELLANYRETYNSLVYPPSENYRASSISSTKTSPFFGLFMDVPLAGATSFLTVQFYLQNMRYNESKKEVDRTITLKTNTTLLNLPILYKYKTTGLKVRYVMSAGPMFGYNINHETILSWEGTSAKDKDFYRVWNFQLSGTIGTGLEFSVGQKKSIGVELKYNVGTGLGKGWFGNTENQKIKELQLMTSFSF